MMLIIGDLHTLTPRVQNKDSPLLWTLANTNNSDSSYILSFTNSQICIMTHRKVLIHHQQDLQNVTYTLDMCYVQNVPVQA